MKKKNHDSLWNVLLVHILVDDNVIFKILCMIFFFFLFFFTIIWILAKVLCWYIIFDAVGTYNLGWCNIVYTDILWNSILTSLAITNFFSTHYLSTLVKGRENAWSEDSLNIFYDGKLYEVTEGSCPII